MNARITPHDIRGDAAIDAEHAAVEAERAAETEVANREAELDAIREQWRANPAEQLVGKMAVAEQRLLNARDALAALRAKHVPARQAATQERARRDHAREVARASNARKRIDQRIADLAALAVKVRTVAGEINAAAAEHEGAARAANEAAGLVPAEPLLPVMPLHPNAVQDARQEALADALRAAFPPDPGDPFNALADVNAASRALRIG
ncbi:MAG: hypothetical protein IT384_23020 [Deltaproteobacteria bacterium]|nr:hypothetical protein [Deltaproteobacteria bacterium]